MESTQDRPQTVERPASTLWFLAKHTFTKCQIKNLRFIRSFLPFFLILAIAVIAVLLIGLSFPNNDSRDILVDPIAQVILLFVFFAFSFLFATIDQIHPSAPKRIVQFGTILGVVLIIHAYLFFSVEIDWLAINNNSKELTLYQSVIKNDLTIFLIMALFLVIHFLSRLREKKKSGNG